MVCYFFGYGRKQFSKWEHLSTKKSYWVTFLWSASRCLFFIRPNTLLLCISLFCIFLLYRTDLQVEVHIRILLWKIWNRVHWQSHFDFLKNDYLFSLFLGNNSLANICFSWNPNFLLLRISFLFSINQHLYNHDPFSKHIKTFLW